MADWKPCAVAVTFADPKLRPYTAGIRVGVVAPGATISVVEASLFTVSATLEASLLVRVIVAPLGPAGIDNSTGNCVERPGPTVTLDAVRIAPACGCRVMVAVADLVGSATLVAVSTTGGCCGLSWKARCRGRMRIQSPRWD